MILKCKCGDYRSPAADYQNKRYGVGNRVHNPAKVKSGEPPMARCTVCGDKNVRSK